MDDGIPNIPILNGELWFPPVEEATAEGIVALGGDLSPQRLLLAYSLGIFPWFDEDSPIVWWSPDPRMVLFPNELRVSKSMRSLFKKQVFTVTKNAAFAQVLNACASIPRKGQEGTWITPEMQEAYLQLHQKGHAHSYEVWEGGFLVGGLYGVDQYPVFCGESMFSKVSNASKYAFIAMVRDLKERGYILIDCQVYTKHLESLGAREIPREQFLSSLIN